jgi:hypothetical protein
MKKQALIRALLVALTTLIFAVPGLAAPPSVDDFLGVPWGSTMQQAEKALKHKKGFKQTPLDDYYKKWIKENEAPGYGEIDFDGTVANHFAHVMLDFQNNSLYEGRIHFVDQNQPSFSKLKQYSSEWKNKKFILNLYEEIQGMLVEKYGEPERKAGAGNAFSDESVSYLIHISTGWSLTGGAAEDEIDLKCEGVSPYYISRADNFKSTGYVALTYTNQSLRKRLLSSKPMNTSQDL